MLSCHGLYSASFVGSIVGLSPRAVSDPALAPEGVVLLRSARCKSGISVTTFLENVVFSNKVVLKNHSSYK